MDWEGGWSWHRCALMLTPKALQWDRLCKSRGTVPTTGLIWAARIGSSMASVSSESIFLNVCVGLLSRYCERRALSETRRGEIPNGSSKSLPSSLPSSAILSALSSTLGELIHLLHTLVGWDPSSASRRICVLGCGQHPHCWYRCSVDG
jgi:hypothetical protein